MNWILIDKDKCSNCGICATRCLRCFTFKEKISAAQADEATCVLCGHCVALCPNDAIWHSQLNMAAFKPIGETIRFTKEDFWQLVSERRSHRHFKKETVPREVLEQLLDLVQLCPTGGNLQPVQVTIICNQEKLDRLSSLTVAHLEELMRGLDDQVASFRASKEPVPDWLDKLVARFSRYRTLKATREAGLDPIFYRAPVTMVFHTQGEGATPKDDCVIAAQTVVLAARTMGLESCYIGLFTGTAKDNKPVMSELGLGEDHEVHSTLVLGYPRLEFLKKVARKPLRVSWG